MRILYFTQDNCHSCDVQEKEFDKLEISIPIEKIYASTQWPVFQEFGVKQTPVLVLLDGNVEAGRRIGPVYLQELKDWINS